MPDKLAEIATVSATLMGVVSFIGLIYKLITDLSFRKETNEKLNAQDLKIDEHAKGITNNVLNLNSLRLRLDNLEKTAEDTHLIMSDHIKYSRANHPTNEKVFPILDNILEKIDRINDENHAAIQRENEELKKKLEKLSESK